MSDQQSIARFSTTRIIGPFVIAGAATALAWVATGASLGLFLAGISLAIVLVPSITLTTDSARSRLAPLTAIVNGIAVVWLMTCFTGTIALSQWFMCYLLLLAICIALAGLVSLLCRFGAHPIISSAITITFAMLWTTWPVWLSATMRDWSHPTLVHWLVQLNPALAMNGILTNLGPWSQMPMAYHLTDLGQNIAYSLPAYGVACIVAHLLLGYTLLLWSARKSRTLP